jgi:P pilus assembly chaperone PapD
MSRSRIATWFATLLALAVAPAIVRAVIVSPTAVFLGDRERSSQVTLFNNSAAPEEITLELRYGYPDTDSTGALVYRLYDSAEAGAPSAASFVSVYPRRVVLAPGARQVVRLVGAPPQGLPEREYWARLVVKSNPQTVVDITGADPGVRAGIQLEMRTVIPVLYRRGEVRTALRLDSIDARRSGDSLTAVAVLQPEGNAAYIGTAVFELLDGRGAVATSWRMPVAVHLRQRRRFVFRLPPESTQPGQQYRLRISVAAERNDLAGSRILPAPRVEAVVQLQGG